MAVKTLYTAEVLGLATALAAYPWDEALPLKGEARSRSCGSTLALAAALDADGRVAKVALRSHACAIGQAAAAIFARAAVGRTLPEIERAGAQIEGWLAEAGLNEAAGEGADADPIPDWPGLAAIAAARRYPGRHGAIMLAWQAARDLAPARGVS